MVVLAGQIYVGQGEFDEGWIELASPIAIADRARFHEPGPEEGGRVLARGRGAPPSAPDARGVVIPAPVNAHTHAGDAFLRGKVPDGLSLAEVVAPPDGFKHRMLRERPREEILEGMRAFARECASAGLSGILDFREGGAEGVALLREAFRGTRVAPFALGRPAAPNDADLTDVVSISDGIGLSAERDVGHARADLMAREARAAGKRFALHASEAEREPIEGILGLGPAFLVHMCRATPSDLEAVAADRVPIVLCPRSNARFGLSPPVEAMIAARCRLALGSDNAMFQSPSIFADLALLLARHPDRRAELVTAALEGGRDILFDGAGNGALAVGGRGGVLVLAPEGTDPVAALVAHGNAPTTTTVARKY